MISSIYKKPAFQKATTADSPSRTLNFKNKLKGVKQSILFSSKSKKHKDTDHSSDEPTHTKKRKLTEIIKSKKTFLKRVLVALLSLITIAFIISLLFGTEGSSDYNNSSGNVTQSGPIDKSELNKEFVFPLKDSKGEEISRIKYNIESVETRDEIVVKGQKATAVQGRVFLILNLKITNEHNQGIEIDSRDYVRLSRNGSGEEWLAPDIHNDPVEVQAISTKLTRVGFPIDQDDVDLVLRVGEIRGEKEEIPIQVKLVR